MVIETINGFQIHSNYCHYKSKIGNYRRGDRGYLGQKNENNLFVFLIIKKK